MTIERSHDQARELSLEAERKALQDHLTEALRPMTRQELREVVDRLCGPGTADAVLTERRRQAEEAHRMVQRLWDERYRDDPTGAARAEARVRRTRERITAQTEQIAQARAARLTSRSDCADMS
ncbi:hypothetical protein AB0F17_59985 [Nonomuraea sp. NPDC026600]|uniref:hypothetical protein n=1 Tax=Nonomuraea sp. NPDC026600 TaxID=3155363 RepID=UPI0033F44900